MSNRTTQVAADQQLADGLTKSSTKVGTFVIGGKQFTAADVVQVLNGRISAAQAATLARANLTAAATTVQTELATSRALIKTVRQMLRVMFANDISLLATFGLAPVKETKPKPATKVNAAAKSKATREARGTKGKKQRSTIQAPAQAAAATAPVAATTPAPATKPQS